MPPIGNGSRPAGTTSHAGDGYAGRVPDLRPSTASARGIRWRRLARIAAPGRFHPRLAVYLAVLAEVSGWGPAGSPTRADRFAIAFLWIRRLTSAPAPEHARLRVRRARDASATLGRDRGATGASEDGPAAPVTHHRWWPGADDRQVDGDRGAAQREPAGAHGVAPRVASLHEWSASGRWINFASFSGTLCRSCNTSDCFAGRLPSGLSRA